MLNDVDVSATSGLARLQRLLGGVLMGAATAVALALNHFGLPPWAAGLAGLAFASGHAWLLAVEFLLLSRVDPGAGLPRPTGADLLRAWWGEVLTGLLVFGWRQPYRWRRHRDWLDPVPGGGRGVLLVHGFVCNRGLWNPWMPRLRKAGVSYVAVNLEPVFGSIDAYVPIIDAAVRRLQAATGRPPLIVAHSMGGLAVRAWLREHAADDRIHGVVTVGTPHHGTWLARFAVSANTRQMSQASHWSAALAAAETPARRARFTCFYSHTDNIVFPASTGMLDGARNRHLPGVAHVHLVYQPAVWREVRRRLAEPAAAA